MKPPPCVADRWVGGSLTRRPKGSFAVSYPRKLGEQNVITITILLNDETATSVELQKNTQHDLKIFFVVLTHSSPLVLRNVSCIDVILGKLVYVFSRADV